MILQVFLISGVNISKDTFEKNQLYFHWYLHDMYPLSDCIMRFYSEVGMTLRWQNCNPHKDTPTLGSTTLCRNAS